MVGDSDNKPRVVAVKGPMCLSAPVVVTPLVTHSCHILWNIMISPTYIFFLLLREDRWWA